MATNPLPDDAKVSAKIEQKFQLMAKLQDVKAEIRKVDLELVKTAGGRPDVQAVLLAW